MLVKVLVKIIVDMGLEEKPPERVVKLELDEESTIMDMVNASLTNADMKKHYKCVDVSYRDKDFDEDVYVGRKSKIEEKQVYKLIVEKIDESTLKQGISSAYEDNDVDDDELLNNAPNSSSNITDPDMEYAKALSLLQKKTIKPNNKYNENTNQYGRLPLIRDNDQDYPHPSQFINQQQTKNVHSNLYAASLPQSLSYEEAQIIENRLVPSSSTSSTQQQIWLNRSNYEVEDINRRGSSSLLKNPTMYGRGRIGQPIQFEDDEEEVEEDGGGGGRMLFEEMPLTLREFLNVPILEAYSSFNTSSQDQYQLLKKSSSTSAAPFAYPAYYNFNRDFQIPPDNTISNSAGAAASNRYSPYIIKSTNDVYGWRNHHSRFSDPY